MYKKVFFKIIFHSQLCNNLIKPTRLIYTTFTTPKFAEQNLHQLPFYSPITAVGPRVGLVEGPAVGTLLGTSLGDDDDGITEGAADVSPDGFTLGTVVGAVEGPAVGTVLGASLGDDDDGITDGHEEGIVVGDAVGSTDGDALGLSLGDDDGITD